MRWLLLIAACGRVDLHTPEDPPPLTCNGDFTWSDAAPFTQSVTAFRAGSTLVVRLTEAKNACAEVLTDGGDEVVEIAIDGAATFCAACTSTRASTSIRAAFESRASRPAYERTSGSPRSFS